MNVFMTGAGGYVGGVVARRLLDDGLQVVALSRSPASDERFAAIGAEPCRGDLADTGALRSHAAAADAIVHKEVDQE